MGRGHGGYTEISSGHNYKDSGGRKVTDSGAIFVAEKYIDAGYESVFRQRHDNQQTYDLTIKTSDDAHYVKNIEVKQVVSKNPSKLATNIDNAFNQVKEGGTVAIYLSKMKRSDVSERFAREGFAEAQQKGWVIGKVEVWFSDTKSVNDKFDLN